MSNIVPTVGRVMWFTPSPACHPSILGGRFKPPYAAHVAYVNEDGTVNVMVISPSGDHQIGAQNVLVVQDGTPPPIHPETGEITADFVEWMPYQKGQAAKTDDGVAQLAGRIEQLAARLKTLQGQLTPQPVETVSAAVPTQEDC